MQPEDWVHHKKYDQYVLAIEEMLERTDTEWGRWVVVEATDRRWTRVRIFDTLIRRLEHALESRGLPLPEPEAASEPSPDIEDAERLPAIEPPPAVPEEV